MKKIILSSLAAAVVSSSAVYFVLTDEFAVQNESVLNLVNDFIEESYSQEKAVIEKFPIYEDWIKVNDETVLRKYLYKYHIPAARKYGVKLLEKDDDISAAAGRNELVRLNDSAKFYYFYGVPEKYRYLTPDAEKMLESIGNRVNEKLAGENISFILKLAVSSAVRPSAYQKKLSLKNANAIEESTHSYGVSIDIFYDDYFVSFPEKKGDDLGVKIYSRLRSRTGFILGDSLRRQFHSLVASTLIEMQNEGLIYVINENHQKCFHVTIAKP
ncbi:MAG: hypothetical protein JW982_12565 [Spirochaetes bacterium]|nr:hypothetical protein [Spirochaetota bacterium]